MPETKKLLLVESPAKARTISAYLGSGYEVFATRGHVIDLPPDRMGVDIENEFKPEYEFIKGKKQVYAEIQKTIKTGKITEILLGTDPDREGEAIASHLKGLLDKKGLKFFRVRFHEVTKKAILSALKETDTLDSKLVEAQEARRILDRLTGYSISPVLWKILFNYTLSAGRVQSVVLKWICEREQEIRNFKSKKIYHIYADVNYDGNSYSFQFQKYNNKKIELEDKDTADKILNDLKILAKKNPFLTITGIEKEKVNISPPPPFMTSTLQKEASNRLGFSPKKTMQTAQKLYDGLNAGPEHGRTGLITYMRTDSTRINPDAASKRESIIKSKFGENYKGKGTGKTSGGAHEAIRPVHPEITPDSIRQYLSPDEFKLYELIWNRFVASGMAPSQEVKSTVNASLGDYSFHYNYNTILFDGFKKLLGVNPEKNKTINWKEKDRLDITELRSEETETEPPARYTEASLVEKLEKTGIGRPSTYASILSVLYERKYIEQKKKSIYPTEIGETVNGILVLNFKELLDDKFTAKMEEELDLIASGNKKSLELLKTFYEDLKLKIKNVKKPEKQKKETKLCPVCAGELKEKISPKKKKYLICSKFPDCEYTVYI